MARPSVDQVDEQYALALALLAPERMDIRGVVAAHFADRAGNRGIDLSFDEIGRVLDRVRMAGRFPVLRGSHALRYSDEPQPSEGVDFILEEARRATPEDPLWVGVQWVSLSPITPPTIIARNTTFRNEAGSSPVDIANATVSTAPIPTHTA